MNEGKVILNLKDPILDYLGKEIHETSRLEKTSEEIRGMTSYEVEKLSPILDVGTLLLRMFATSIKTKDKEDASKSYVYITALRNKYQTNKGEWQIEEKDLKELSDYIGKVEGVLLSPMMAGQINEKITDLQLELKEKSRKNSKE